MAVPAVPEELDELLKLVLDMCTIGQIKALLRLRKEDDSVRMSAENKKILVERNLREAILGGAVKQADVFELIQRSEENGAKHIWYHKLKVGLLPLMSADAPCPQVAASTALVHLHISDTLTD
jgi:hypothetical protein